jgi:hypothetical protein
MHGIASQMHALLCALIFCDVPLLRYDDTRITIHLRRLCTAGITISLSDRQTNSCIVVVCSCILGCAFAAI